MKLRISDDLALPLDAVTQKLAWLGRTGSGKTYGASKLAEEMIGAGAQVVVLDAVGVWYGLRLGADGRSPGIEIPVFGGLHGDVPLEPTGGALVANLVVDRGISVIIDVSQFESDAQKARFAQEWADRFFFRKKAAPSAVHLFVEECQEFVPQNPQRGEERMLHAFQRIEKLGRNFGIGVSLISQRPQEVNKKALNQTECLFAFQMTGPQERKAIEAWVADKDLEEDVGAVLPKLEVGQAHVWSPQWLRTSRSVHIAKKRTFNASTTPTVGQRAAERNLAPIDLDRIRADMAATIERAKADDPKELRRELAAARAKVADLEKRKVPAAPAAKEKRVEVPIVKDAQIARLEAALKRGEAILEKLRAPLEQLRQIEENARAAATEISKAIVAAKVPAPPREGLALGKRIGTWSASTAPRPEPPAPNGHDAREPLGGPKQRIIDSLAWWEQVGVRAPENAAVAWRARYSPTSSSYTNPRGALRSEGLIEYPGSDLVALSAAGRMAARYPKTAPVAEEFQREVLGLLSGPEARILQPLLAAYPEALTSDQLAGAAGYSETSSSFTNPRGHLRTLGLIEYPGPNLVRARAILFLETGEGARA